MTLSLSRSGASSQRTHTEFFAFFSLLRLDLAETAVNLAALGWPERSSEPRAVTAIQSEKKKERNDELRQERDNQGNGGAVADPVNGNRPSSLPLKRKVPAPRRIYRRAQIWPTPPFASSSFAAHRNDSTRPSSVVDKLNEPKSRWSGARRIAAGRVGPVRAWSTV